MAFSLWLLFPRGINIILTALRKYIKYRYLLFKNSTLSTFYIYLNKHKNKCIQLVYTCPALIRYNLSPYLKFDVDFFSSLFPAVFLFLPFFHLFPHFPSCFLIWLHCPIFSPVVHLSLPQIWLEFFFQLFSFFYPFSIFSLIFPFFPSFLFFLLSNRQNFSPCF